MNVEDMTKQLVKHLRRYDVFNVCYFDKVSLYIDEGTRESDLSRILSSNEKNKITPKEYVANSHLKQFVELFQLNKEDLKELMVIVKGDYRIVYVECSIDFMTSSEETLKKLDYFFNRHLVHEIQQAKSRAFYYEDYNDLEETIYFGPNETYRLLKYIDKPARKAEKNNPKKKCLHLEYRARGTDVVITQRIDTIKNLLNFDHFKLWDTLLDFRKLNATELGRFISMSKGEPELTRKTYGQRGKKVWDTIHSLQEYLQDNPENESAFKKINTLNVLKKLVDDAFNHT